MYIDDLVLEVDIYIRVYIYIDGLALELEDADFCALINESIALFNVQV